MSVGLVLAGGGARGAYEAGVLAELLPWLEARGERPTTFVGTSVGALGAAFLASVAHRPAQEAADALVEHWLELRQELVIRPILAHSSARTVLRYGAEFLGLPGARLDGLLDPAPLRGRSRSGWTGGRWRRTSRTGPWTRSPSWPRACRPSARPSS